MNFTVNRLSGAGGAEVRGLDLSQPIGDNLAQDLRQAWLDHGGIMVVRDQHLSSEQHIAFARHFGPLFGAPGESPLQDTVSRYIHPDYPELYRVSNKLDETGEPLGRARAGTYWHSDVSFRERPAAASILYAREIPPIGGDTLFANMTLAYEALSDGLKAMLAPLYAVHDFAVAAATQYARPIVVGTDMDGANRARHPIVRTHAETGAKSLFVNPGFTLGIDGFTADESRAVLEPLYRHAMRPEFVYRQQWQPHDLLIWDNRSLMHYAVADYGDAPRYLERTTCIGDRPV